MKDLVTPSSIFYFFYFSSTGELCSQPVRDEVCRTGRIFPEHVELSFLDAEYSSTNTPNYIREAKVCPINSQLYSPNTPNYVCEQMFAQLRTGFMCTAHVFVFSWSVPSPYMAWHIYGERLQVLYLFLWSSALLLWGVCDKEPASLCTRWKLRRNPWSELHPHFRFYLVSNMW